KVAVTKPGSIAQTVTTRGNGRGGGGTTSRSTTVTPTVVTVYSSPLADQSKLAQLLPILLDKCTTQKATELPPRLNINTAPLAALQTLPGLTETDIEAIQS